MINNIIRNISTSVDILSTVSIKRKDIHNDIYPSRHSANSFNNYSFLHNGSTSVDISLTVSTMQHPPHYYQDLHQ